MLVAKWLMVTLFDFIDDQAVSQLITECAMQCFQTRQDCDVKLSTIWQQLLLLQGQWRLEWDIMGVGGDYYR